MSELPFACLKSISNRVKVIHFAFNNKKYAEFKLIKIIRKLAKNGLGILMILHDINLAYKFSNKIALMLDGKVKYFGNPKKVINQKNLEKIYGLKMKIFTKPFFIKYY